jgi:hypothetical protein
VVFTHFYKVSDKSYIIFKLICCCILNSYSDCDGGDQMCMMVVVVCICVCVCNVKHLMVNNGQL